MRFQAETVVGLTADVSSTGESPMRNSMGASPSHSQTSPSPQSQIPNAYLDHVTQQELLLHKSGRAGNSIAYKQPGTFRFFSLNVNGFSKGDPLGAMLHAADSCIQAKVDFAGFSETNLDYNNHKFRMKTRKALSNTFPHSKVNFSSSRIMAPDVQKFGGTMSLAFKDACCRTVKSFEDPSGLGRYNVFLIRGNGRRGLAIFTIYAASDRRTSGPTTFATQQRTILRMRGLDPDVDLKQLLWKDIKKELEPLLKQGYYPILMGDFNESIYSDNSGLRKLMKDAQLYDPLTFEDVHRRDIATHSRGSKRIDYILVSNELRNSVRSSGVTALDEIIDSDHRAIFCDIDFESAFQTPLAPIITPEGRRVRSKNTTQSVKFLAKFDELMKARSVHKRAQEVLNMVAKNGPCQEASRKMRGVDKDLRDALICAERRSGTAYSPPWSKELHFAFLECRFWNIYCRRFGDLALAKEILQPIATELKWPALPILDMDEASKKRRESQKKAKNIREKAERHREEMLEDDLNNAASAEDKNKAKALRAIARCEATRRSYLKLRFATKGRQSGGLAAVQQLKPDGQIETVTKPDEMIPLLLEAGRRHFSQANGTPFTKGPLATLEYTGTCFQADAILRGCSTFSYDEKLESSHRQWIAHARHLDHTLNPTEISSWLTPDQIKEGYSKWKESTSTSPAGDHLSIYKVLAKDFSDVDKKDIPKGCRPLHIIQQEAWDSITAIMNLGCHFGLTIPRWETAVCTMIEKAPGNFLLHKLRRIFIFASDYNLSLGIIVGRRLVWNAEDKGRIHKDLWGSRTGRSAPDATLMKETTYEVARLTNTPLASFDNDAKSCYDRIVMTVAALLARRQGLPKTTAAWMNETMKFMKNYVKTALGQSDEYFGSSDGTKTEKHGPGQGHRAAPALWLIISSFLFERMDILARGVSFRCPTGTLSHSRKLDGYVDDVSAFFNLFDQSISGEIPKPAILAKGMKGDAAAWANQLFISGGALELSKCFWYLLYPVVGKDNHPSWASVHDLHQQSAEIELVCPMTAKRQCIELKDVGEGHKTLGAHKCINGNQTLQIEVLREKSTTFAAAMRTIFLTREEATTAAEHILAPKLGYPLSTSALTEKQCHYIHSPGLTECIRGAGYCKSMPRAVIHGPLALGGTSMTNLYASQTWLILDALQHHLRQNLETANLIRICLSWTQLVSGISRPILEDCTTPLSYCRRSTLIALREGLKKCSGHIQIYDAPSFPVLRINDCMLMEKAIETYSQPSVLRDINFCRLYLGVLSIADICSPDGMHVQREAYNCVTRRYRHSTLLWPNIPAPNERQLKRWRRFILTLLKPFLGGRRPKADADRGDLQLKQPLGRWLRPPNTRQRFNILKAGSETWTYDETFRIYRSGNKVTFPNNVDHGWLPGDPIDHDTTKRKAYFPYLPKYQPGPGQLRYHQQLPLNIFPSQDIWDYADDWEKIYIENMHYLQSSQAHLLSQVKVILVSDGSVEQKKGGFGCIIGTPWGQRLVGNFGSVHGYDPSSFRAEAHGMLANAIAYRLMRKGNRPIGGIFVSDNEGLIKVMTKAFKYPRPFIERNQNEEDLIRAIVGILEPFRDEIEFKWVKGHQDDYKKKSELSLEAQMNVESDDLADRGRETDTWLQIPPVNPFSQTILVLNKKGATSNQRRAILDASTFGAMKEYIMRRNNMTEDIFCSTNWDALGSAIKGFSIHQRTTLTKFAHDHLPLGVRIHQRKEGEPHSCQSCKNGTIESDWHLLRCKGQDRWRTTAKTAVQQRLLEMKTSPHLTATVLNVLFFGLDDKFVRDPDGKKDMESEVSQSNIWKGRLPMSWCTMFEKEAPKTSRYKCGFTWARQLIICIFRQIFPLWNKRNRDRHGETEETIREIRREKVMQRLKKLNRVIRRLTNPRDKGFFYDPKEDLTKSPTHVIDSYLSWAYPLATRCLLEQDNNPPGPTVPPAPNLTPNRDGVTGTSQTPPRTQKTQSTVTERSSAANPGLPLPLV